MSFSGVAALTRTEAARAGDVCATGVVTQVVGWHFAALKSERGLTGREKEILVLVSKGCSNAEIGDIPHLSPNTVKNHLKNLFEALGAADRAEAVAIGIRRGLIS